MSVCDWLLHSFVFCINEVSAIQFLCVSQLLLNLLSGSDTDTAEEKRLAGLFSDGLKWIRTRPLCFRLWCAGIWWNNNTPSTPPPTTLHPHPILPLILLPVQSDCNKSWTEAMQQGISLQPTCYCLWAAIHKSKTTVAMGYTQQNKKVGVFWLKLSTWANWLKMQEPCLLILLDQEGVDPGEST